MTTTYILYVDVNSFKAPTNLIISNAAQFLPVDVGVSFDAGYFGLLLPVMG